jgi:imidazolonepropionase
VTVRVAADTLLRHARELLTMTGELPSADAKGSWDEGPLGIVRDGAVAAKDGVVVAVGTTAAVEAAVTLDAGARVVDVGDALVAPALIDCHTHALFVGDRSDEYGLRVQGATYAEIAARGGGIASSVRALRAASDEALLDTLRARLDRMASFGVGTVEVKTGYALDTAHELRCLDLLRRCGARVVPTFLPLHAVPPELRGVEGGRQRYLARVLDEMLPAVVAQGAARFIDAYIDGPGFSVAEASPTLERARALGLRARLHVGQFEDVGGAEFAAEIGAASADHLEHVSEGGLRAMAAAGVVGVLLPTAAFTLGQAMPDARRMRALGVEVAVATDCNPGTSHNESLPLAVSFAVRQMGLTTVEAWWAVTRAAARSLGQTRGGTIERGLPMALSIFELPSWQALPAHLGRPLVNTLWVA